MRVLRLYVERSSLKGAATSRSKSTAITVLPTKSLKAKEAEADWACAGMLSHPTLAKAKLNQGRLLRKRYC
jgi:hypothetical protein